MGYMNVLYGNWSNMFRTLCQCLVLLVVIVEINLLTPSGFLPYHQGLTFKNSIWRSLCVECFERISEQTATFALYTINRLAFITVVESVYCAVRTDSLYEG
jgi:hypothetical protein